MISFCKVKSQYIELLFSLSVLIFLLPNSEFIQQDYAIISGQVFDAATLQPLPGANVYLKGVGIGDAADLNGKFIIDKIPPRKYTLVVSMIGYKLYEVQIDLQAGQHRRIDFYLKQKILKGQKVTVTAKYPKEWRKNLKVFVQAFFGLSKYARECKILNAEVLDFNYNRKTGMLNAYAQAPLRFVNQAMGYVVSFKLKKFDVKTYDRKIYNIEYVPGKHGRIGLIRFGKLTCIGEAAFQELHTENAEEKRKWKKNREIAYRGSLQHFLQALCQKKLKKHGYMIWRAIPGRKVYFPYIAIDSVIQKTNQPGQFVLRFPKELGVRYFEEKDYIMIDLKTNLARLKYLNNINQNYDRDILEKEISSIEIGYRFQDSSLLVERGKKVIVNNDGTIPHQTAELWVGRWWGWGFSAAEWLPLNKSINFHRKGWVTMF